MHRNTIHNFKKSKLIGNTKAQATKANMDKWDYIEMKTSMYQRTQYRVKRQSKEWEKLSVNHISTKGLVFRMYEKKLLQLNNKTTKNPI